MSTVSVNPPKTPVTKGSNGTAPATIPNVCKMPGPPAPFIPTPLPNIGKSGMSPKDYSKDVTFDGNAVAIKGSTFESMGDIASKGTGGGLISANTHGITKFIGPGSMDVKVEGKNVQLLSDPMLNNCGPGGSPPNAATLLGLIQGPLLVVVEGTEKCPICEKGSHGLSETEATKAEAATLEGSLKGAGFAADEINMLCVAHCRCSSKKSAARSTMTRSGDFTKAATGIDFTPSYADFAKASDVIAKIKKRTTNGRAFEAALAEARQRRKDFEKTPIEKRPTKPQVNVPGTCAAPRAILLLLEAGHAAGALTERWCGSAVMTNPVSHYDMTSGTRRLVEDRVFNYGDSVPPCLACDALLPLLLCDEELKCPK